MVTFRPYEPDQQLLLPPSLREWLPIYRGVRRTIDYWRSDPKRRQCFFVGGRGRFLLAAAASSPLRRLVGRSERWPRQRPKIHACGTPQGELKSEVRCATRRGLQGEDLLPLHSDPPLAAAGGCARFSVLD